MLDNLIIIEKRTHKGALVNDEWHKAFSCWASVDCVNAEDYTTSSKGATEIKTTYKIRNTKSLKELLESYNTREFRLIHKGKPHDIKSVIEYDKKGEYLKINCIRRI